MGWTSTEMRWRDNAGAFHLAVCVGASIGCVSIPQLIQFCVRNTDPSESSCCHLDPYFFAEVLLRARSNYNDPAE